VTKTILLFLSVLDGVLMSRGSSDKSFATDKNSFQQNDTVQVSRLLVEAIVKADTNLISMLIPSNSDIDYLTKEEKKDSSLSEKKLKMMKG